MVADNRDITVAVVCFDYGAYLPEAVGSALSQEGGPPRVVVLDDGSTDPATIEALERLPPEVEVRRQANAGLPAARNAAFAGAQTPLLIALDADDLLAPGALQAMRRPLDQDADLGFAYGMTRLFGDWSGEIAMPPYDPYVLLYRNTITSTTLMRRTMFEQLGGFDPAFRYYEDWELWLRALKHGWRGRQVPETTLLYRRHGDTHLSTARRDYRLWYRRLRRKHADLYARRAELARESSLGPAGRFVHRAYWGPRPIPARLEHALYRRIFRG